MPECPPRDFPALSWHGGRWPDRADCRGSGPLESQASSGLVDLRRFAQVWFLGFSLSTCNGLNSAIVFKSLSTADSPNCNWKPREGAAIRMGRDYVGFCTAPARNVR